MKDLESTARTTGASAAAAGWRREVDALIEEVIIAAYWRGFEWRHANGHDKAFLTKAARDFADYIMHQEGTSAHMLRSRLQPAAAGEAPCAAAVSSNQSAAPPVQMEAVRSSCEVDWRASYIRARDALYQFQYPPDPKMLREIADEIDCGSDCEHGHTEWDTNAHVCSRSDRGECTGEKAWHLRQFADAIGARAEIVDPLAPSAQMEAVAWQPIETAPKDGTIFDVWLGNASDDDVAFYCTEGTRRSCGWSWEKGKFRPLGGLKVAMPVFEVPTHWMPLPLPPSASPVPSSERDDIIEMCAAWHVRQGERCADLAKEHLDRGNMESNGMYADEAQFHWTSAAYFRSLKSQPAQESGEGSP